jgi:hypothetical protein
MSTNRKGVDPEADSKKNPQAELLKRGTQDPTSVRAKNSGHGKKTADKWNQ